MKWLAKEFDFTTGRYTGDYYDLTTINWFVDSDLGNDSTGTGSATNPWKTIGKLISDSSVVTGHRVMINGIFTEDTIITKQLRIIGCGGGRNGKTIFNNGGGSNFIRITSAANKALENVELANYNTTINFITAGVDLPRTMIGSVNCIFKNVQIRWEFIGTGFLILNFYYNYLDGVNFNFNGSNASIRIYVGSNNTLFNCTKDGGASSRVYITDNNHINNTMEHVVDGVNNIVNTDGQYFSPANNDFNFPDTSPLYLTGTLDTITGIPNNVGAGRLGEFRNADLFEFKVIGGAEFTNTEPDGDDIFRTNDTIDGYFESGIIDLNEIKRGVKIGIHNSYTESGGALTKLIQETDGLTVRQGLDCELIIGNTANEVITKKLANDWLLYEYGKPVTVTIDGLNTYGNADPLFDPTDFIFPAFRFFKIKFRFKNA
jgi:hypothetical protein